MKLDNMFSLLIRFSSFKVMETVTIKVMRITAVDTIKDTDTTKDMVGNQSIKIIDSTKPK